MKFNCKELSIDDEEFGCTISFGENEEKGQPEEEQTIDQIMASIGQYITLQRTYPEDEDEKDFYYFESSNFDQSGELADFKIDLYRTQFVMDFNRELYEIQLNVSDKKFEKLKTVLLKITNGKGHVNFHH